MGILLYLFSSNWTVYYVMSAAVAVGMVGIGVLQTENDLVGKW
jgi:hypothetical protein